MRRTGSVRAVLVILLFTGAILARPDWRSCPQRAVLPAGGDRDRASTPDALTQAAALRWCQGQPRHWRACLLQH